MLVDHAAPRPRSSKTKMYVLRNFKRCIEEARQCPKRLERAWSTLGCLSVERGLLASELVFELVRGMDHPPKVIPCASSNCF